MGVVVNRYMLDELTEEARSALLARGSSNFDDIEPTVQAIVAAVRSRGAEAVREFTREFDGVDVPPEDIRVTEDEFRAAEGLVSPDLREAMERAIASIRAHHTRALPTDGWMAETTPGVITGERVTPVASVGLYVPHGKGSFPSVMMMLCVPATLAKVPRIVVCTPPAADGSIDPACLLAARLCGVDTVYKVGGAQAVAALAYGTENIAKVDKIVGPGNRYVSAARRMVYGVVNPGLPAGPSESIVLCADGSDLETAAYELMVEAEHGPDSAALLVTHEHESVDVVEKRVHTLLGDLPEPRRTFIETVLTNHGGFVLTSGLEQSIDFVNEYAPEHLRVLGINSFELLSRIVNAGEVLLGEHSSIPFGNFAIGVNAILPTGRGARSYSCVGIEEFTKRSSFAYVSREGVPALASVAATLADYEGFPTHAAAARHAGEVAES